MPKKYMSTTEGRFAEFRDRLKAATGDKAVLFRGVNSVHVLANGFSPLREFRSVQAAIDNFARYFPTNFVNKD